MTVVAGVDVGNATTEVVLVRFGPLDSVEILAADRLATRGAKGSTESLELAAAVVRKTERKAETGIDRVVLAELRAVRTSSVSSPSAPADTGRLRIVADGVSTPGGFGSCVGRPIAIEDLWTGPERITMPPGPLIAVVGREVDYRQAVDRLRWWCTYGAVGAVVLGGDDGVLVANRLGVSIPVVDQVDVQRLQNSLLLAVEVVPPGRSLQLLGDPIALANAFGLVGSEASAMGVICRAIADRSNAVVSLEPGLSIDDEGTSAWVSLGDEAKPLRDVIDDLRRRPPGPVECRLGADGPQRFDDLYAVDLAEVAERAGARRRSLVSTDVIVACLQGHAADMTRVSETMAGLLDVPVSVSGREVVAARTGALTTPGASPDAVVVDLGAGTIDVSSPAGEVVAAGAGALLSLGVSLSLGIPVAAGEWVKRGPCMRIEGGTRFEAEDGTRGFLERPGTPSASGMLAVPGPAGLLPFDRHHSPAEWRAFRLRLKEAVLADNLSRAMSALESRGMQRQPRDGQVLVVGGPAGDEELLAVLARRWPGEVLVGRGAVGGTIGVAGGGVTAGKLLGHRYSVALGLAMVGRGLL
jgi:hypothetical protein